MIDNDNEDERGQQDYVDQVPRRGELRMLAVVIETEANECIERFLGERDRGGRRLVVRNCRAKPRTITTGVGEVEGNCSRRP